MNFAQGTRDYPLPWSFASPTTTTASGRFLFAINSPANSTAQTAEGERIRPREQIHLCVRDFHGLRIKSTTGKAVCDKAQPAKVIHSTLTSPFASTPKRAAHCQFAVASTPSSDSISRSTATSITSMENNSNRFHLNLNNGDRPQFNDRAFPTTPSTFPNPIFPPSQAQGGQQGQGQNAQQQPYSTGFAPAGYFMNNPYPPQYPQQPPTSSYQAPQAPQASYQQRPAAYQANDATNGLVHQFSHQNLGGRASPYGARQTPPPSQRPRTAGAPSQQAYNSYLSAPMPNQAAPQPNMPEFERAPERNPDRYPASAQTNQTKCAQLAETFFKDSVKRARDRNVR